MYAVITGDVVGSTTSQTRGDQNKYGLLDESLTTAFESMMTQGWVSKGDFTSFRGDSFQGVLPAEHGLEAVLLIKSALKGGVTADLKADHGLSWSCRVGMGIGEVTYRAPHVSKSNGPAFHRSGRLLDAMPRDHFVAMASPWDSVNEELELMCRYLDIIIERLWTVKSARSVYVHLKENYTQQEMADLFGISQPALSQRIQSAEWAVLEQTIRRYHSIINLKRQ